MGGITSLGHLLEIPMPRPRTLSILATALAAAAVFACSDRITPVPDFARVFRQSSSSPTITPPETRTTLRIFVVSQVNVRVVWARGAGGMVARTIDCGTGWAWRWV